MSLSSEEIESLKRLARREKLSRLSCKVIFFGFIAFAIFWVIMILAFAVFFIPSLK